MPESGYLQGDNAGFASIMFSIVVVIVMHKLVPGNKAIHCTTLLIAAAEVR
jgi:uncharacterized membrane protein YtjA (UPF0391 family)